MNQFAKAISMGWALLALGGWIGAASAHAKAPSTGKAGGFPPDEAARRMVLPKGFHAEVFASEPMVRQPVTASFDERGRLWVVEYLQYPAPAGLKPVTVDRYLRTEYDKVPKPPPHGTRGADRIKILEDTDGDGRADSVKIFAEGLNLASALAVGHGGVFVGNAPYLLFYPDRDRDDRPDSAPEVLLSGFGLQDAHAVINSLTWGPDGWLYGAQGSTVTARVRGLEFQQGIWRYHPRTRKFELFAEGGGNTWGLDFDAAGNAFGSSNGGFIAFHMVQGGYYWKGFAKHGPLHNPRSYGYFDAIAYEGAKRGGHVTPGGIIYKGDALPASFRGTFIGGNLLANAVYWHDLKPNGSTFSGRHGGTLIDSHDRWFRPIDVLTGPDAAVYVVDWYDRRASHLDPRDNWDKTNGRIYRVVYGDRRKVAPFDLSKRSSAELVALRTSTNDWYAAEARRLLAERRDAALVPELKRLLESDHDETIALRDLWALHVSGGLDDANARHLLDHRLAGVRRWVVRLLGDDARNGPDLQAKLEDLAKHDPSVLVRAQLAASCQRWPARAALPILARLVRHDEDLRDPFLPNQLWWAFERQLRNDRSAVVDLACTTEVRTARLFEAAVLERLARALASDGPEGGFAACARLLNAAEGREALGRVVSGMEQGTHGHALESVPAPLAEALARVWSSAQPTPPPALTRLSARLGLADAVAGALRIAADRTVAAAERVEMIELVGELRRAGDVPALLAILKTDPNAAIQSTAVAALAGQRRPDIAREFLKRYETAGANVRARILGALCSRAAWASALVEAAEQHKIAAKDLSIAHVQQVARLGDRALLERLEALWGKAPHAGSPEKALRIAEVRGMLPEGDKGNAQRGRPIFQENCAVCHKLFGEGETIGPDLTGAQRGDLEFLLQSVVDPSALVRKEYEAQTIALRDGQVLTGLVVDENDRSLVLVDGNRQRTTVLRDRIEERKGSDVSLMPEGLLDKLTEPQIRDLFRYLQSSGPR